MHSQRPALTQAEGQSGKRKKKARFMAGPSSRLEAPIRLVVALERSTFAAHWTIWRGAGCGWTPPIAPRLSIKRYIAPFLITYMTTFSRTVAVDRSVFAAL